MNNLLVDEIHCKIMDSVQELYDKYGIEPNCLLLSRDIIVKLLRSNRLHLKYDDSGICIKTYMGIYVKELLEVDIIKAAIILED